MIRKSEDVHTPASLLMCSLFTKRPKRQQAESKKETEPGGDGGPLALALPLEKQLWWEQREQVGPRLPTQPQGTRLLPHTCRAQAPESHLAKLQ